MVSCWCWKWLEVGLEPNHILHEYLYLSKMSLKVLRTQRHHRDLTDWYWCLADVLLAVSSEDKSWTQITFHSFSSISLSKDHVITMLLTCCCCCLADVVLLVDSRVELESNSLSYRLSVLGCFMVSVTLSLTSSSLSLLSSFSSSSLLSSLLLSYSSSSFSLLSLFSSSSTPPCCRHCRCPTPPHCCWSCHPPPPRCCYCHPPPPRCCRCPPPPPPPPPRRCHCCQPNTLSEC